MGKNPDAPQSGRPAGHAAEWPDLRGQIFQHECVFAPLFGVVHHLVRGTSGPRCAGHGHGMDFHAVVGEEQVGRGSQATTVRIPVSIRHQSGREISQRTQGPLELGFLQRAGALFKNGGHRFRQFAAPQDPLHGMERRGEGGDIEFAPRTHGRLTLQLLRKPVGRNGGGVRVDTPRLQVAQHEVRPVEGQMVRVRLRGLHRFAPRDNPTVLGPGKERTRLQEGAEALG